MLNIAIQAVKQTRQFTIDSFYNAKAFEIKSDKSLVTRTDLNVENNEPLIGVISFPALEKVFYASQGEGCWVQHGNNTPIKISIASNNERKLKDSVISASGIHSTTFDRREGMKAYNLSNIVHTARDTVFINDCYQHVMVSMGRIDAALDTLMKPWDIAALIPCMRESGVVCANLQGSREKLLHGGSLITASSQFLLDELLYALN
ncbi:inositol monophosphatase family protein [Xenorhabdus kozodoii]|uniref:Histidinol-phosphate aminotransferase n=1 Tax=Xenorhabdus kozodoii TaxID=351676 RepID=A0A2D0LGQ7_9GAMM|nr:inositol monophosphatase family protein [Xenorhabdus kozodoii]PHM74896.1 histidinol-phosphate aminotransferase [Xenorhabdus kozodoii]